jgi:hypothetical protein
MKLWLRNARGGVGRELRLSALPLQELLEKEKNAVTTQQRMSDLSLVHVQKVKVVLKSVDQRLGKVQVRTARTTVLRTARDHGSLASTPMQLSTLLTRTEALQPVEPPPCIADSSTHPTRRGRRRRPVAARRRRCCCWASPSRPAPWAARTTAA